MCFSTRGVNRVYGSARLSGGEQLRAASARAVANRLIHSDLVCRRAPQISRTRSRQRFTGILRATSYAHQAFGRPAIAAQAGYDGFAV
ncbi:hypothetical protein X907_1613 [Glycocaulis alkaliphilus]|uniref:Uncharacterized protein n=1 Tax=Glycocaulis alkaliphilus TaxID=1434191 RepID=A0A3T0E9M3_9PROT|nr:hypothetical protein X907_1613 [Glycocaulis alkaliphilus]